MPVPHHKLKPEEAGTNMLTFDGWLKYMQSVKPDTDNLLKKDPIVGYRELIYQKEILMKTIIKEIKDHFNEIAKELRNKIESEEKMNSVLFEIESDIVRVGMTIAMFLEMSNSLSSISEDLKAAKCQLKLTT